MDCLNYPELLRKRDLYQSGRASIPELTLQSYEQALDVYKRQLGMTAFASNTGNVAGAVEGTWKAASGQIKAVVNNVVFPAIDLVLAVLFFVKVATAYMDYRKHGQIEWAPVSYTHLRGIL